MSGDLNLGILLDLPTYERIYSPNWYSMYEELQLPREKWKDADDLWLLYYRNENPAFMPGAKTVLNELAHRNYDLGIVTSGARARVLNELDAFGFTDAFRVMICSEDVVNRKPHPDGLEMGRHAEVLTIAIPSRYPSSRNLAGASPDLFFDSLDQFLSAFISHERSAATSAFGRAALESRPTK